MQRRPTDEILAPESDDGKLLWLTRKCDDGSYTLWLSKHYCVSIFRTFVELKNVAELTRIQVEDVTTNASILEALHNDDWNTLEKPEDGYHLVHLKPNTEFTNEDQKEPRCIAAWVIQSWGERAEQACTNCASGKGIFVDCRTYGGLFDGACANCKKRDHGARCSLSNAFKKAAEEREKAFKKPAPRSTRTSEKARSEV